MSYEDEKEERLRALEEDLRLAAKKAEDEARRDRSVTGVVLLFFLVLTVPVYYFTFHLLSSMSK